MMSTTSRILITFDAKIIALRFTFKAVGVLMTGRDGTIARLSKSEERKIHDSSFSTTDRVRVFKKDVNESDVKK